MNFYPFIPGIICVAVALLVMFRLMHYARFYAPSYFFWIGAILAVAGLVSTIHPLSFLLILNRTVAVCVLCGGVLLSVIALFLPARKHHSQTDLALDQLLPDYSFNEYHEVIVNASVEEVKRALQTTGVRDIPVALMFLKIRGIADYGKDRSDTVTNNQQNSDSFVTPDFNFIVANPFELLTLMVLKGSAKTPPPEITTTEEFRAFQESGYVKVAVNFLFRSLDNGQTLVSTETRNLPMTRKDSCIFGRYWRIIYPGSAIIRRLWLDTLAKKAEQKKKET